MSAFVAAMGTLSASAKEYSFSEISTNEKNFIFGGTEADINDFPFVANLVDNLLQQPFCVGTLISKQYILTAGHCIRSDTFGIIARFGRNESTGVEAFSVPVVEGFRHPMYRKKTHLYDVGLLKLERPIDRPFAQPCAPDGSDNMVGTMATTVGWGKTEKSGKLASRILRRLTLPIISNAECGKYPKYVGRITEGMLCAGTGRGRDTCNGDSGGPLIVDGNILVGFVSWGSTCGEQPAVFTRITYVFDYIRDILRGGDGVDFFEPTSESNSGSQEPFYALKFPKSLDKDLTKQMSMLMEMVQSSVGSKSSDLAGLLEGNGIDDPSGDGLEPEGFPETSKQPSPK